MPERADSSPSASQADPHEWCGFGPDHDGPCSPPCTFGPEGCDPQADAVTLVHCTVCGRAACDYHGTYPTDSAYAEGDWRCPDDKDLIDA